MARAANQTMFFFHVKEIKDIGPGAHRSRPSKRSKDFEITHTGSHAWINGKIGQVPQTYEKFIDPNPVETVTVMCTYHGGNMAHGSDVTEEDTDPIPWSSLGFNYKEGKPSIGWASVNNGQLSYQYSSTWTSLLPSCLRASSQNAGPAVPLVGSPALTVALAASSGPVGQHESTLRDGFLVADDGRRYWNANFNYQRPPNRGVVVKIFACNTPTNLYGCNRQELKLLSNGTQPGPMFDC